MKLELVFKTCNNIVTSLEKKNPGRGINTPDGRITFKELSKELDNLCGWCYKGDIDVQKIIRCKNCKYYRRYKKRKEDNPYDHKVIVICALDKQPHSPEFYCANGEEKEK